MKITDVKSHIISIDLKEVSELAAARHARVIVNLVEVELDNGVKGYGDVFVAGPPKRNSSHARTKSDQGPRGSFGNHHPYATQIR